MAAAMQFIYVAILCTPDAHIRDQYSVEMGNLQKCHCQGELCERVYANNFSKSISDPQAACDEAMSTVQLADQNLIRAYQAEVTPHHP